MAQNAQAKITLHLTTDDGKVLANFPCGAGSWINNLSNPSDRTSSVDGKTDENGNVTLTLPCLFGEVNISTKCSVSGYYPNGLKYQFTNSVGGKWQPWNPTINLVVTPILNPIPMYARSLGVAGSNLNLPAKNTPIGFDLEAADFVAPYGKGVNSDFIFTLSDKESTTSNQTATNISLTLSFPNKGDGIQSVLTPLNQGVSLPFNAPQSGYEAILVMDKDSQYSHGTLRADQNYFFRVRTVLDENGKIKSALYGKITGPIQFWDNAGLEFTYYLNPTPNDRNMEFDPSKNLFQNLPSLQQVNAQ